MEPLFKLILVNLSDAYGLISVSGPDAQSFLQGQLTADIREITSSKHGLGAYCNPKGRIRALFRIFLSENDNNTYYLQLPSSLLPSVLTQLKQVARFSKVTVDDVSQQWQRIGIGFRAPEGAVSTQVLSAIKNSEIFKKFSTVMEAGTVQALHDILILRLAHDYPRFELIGPAESLKPIWDYLTASAKPSDLNAWKCLEIEAGIPEIWPETTEQYLPHVLNLPALGAVSFNKGCYCGQEIVARMEYRGTLKRHLFCATLTDTHTIPLPGTLLYAENNSDEAIGTVVTAAQVSENTVMLLGEGPSDTAS